MTYLIIKLMNSTAEAVEAQLTKYAHPEDAIFLQRFFKIGAGQYGEGDVFIGVRVPMTRLVAKEFKDLPLPEIQKLLNSKVHEHRLAGLVILGNQCKKLSGNELKKRYDFYLKNVGAGKVNNWDLVDVSAEYCVGKYLLDQPRDILFQLAKSNQLWERRVAIISTFAFLKAGDPATTLAIAEILLHDPHDLIQKAVGWMLREVGKKVDRELLIDFLEKYAATMPRTMLRYAIEHLPIEQRRYFMAMKTLHNSAVVD